MPTDPESDREPRRPLTRERVLRAGIDFADAHGIAPLTMRRLGEALGVEGMALYRHVASKDDLLGGMLDLALSEAQPPIPGGEWKAELRRGALSTFEVLLRHPWMCELHMSSGGGTGPARVGQMNAILGALRKGGFSVERTHHAYHVLDIYVYGFALGTVSFPVDKQDLAPIAEAFLAELPSEQHPHLVEHIRYHLDTDVLGEGDFEFGLDLLLDSLERLRDESGDADAAGPPAAAEEAKAVVHELVEAWNAMDRAAYARLADPSHLEEDLRHFDEIAGAFSGLRATVEDMIAENNVVAARLLVSATHDRGPFAGVEPTGTTLTWGSFRFYRVRDGRVVASWAMQDRLGLFQQLGLVPRLEDLVHWAAEQPDDGGGR